MKKSLLEKGENGNALDKYAVAVAFTEEDKYNKAFEWFLKSAEMGYAKAQWKVACYFNEGFQVKKDVAKAFEWALKAALQGDDGAMNFIGCQYSDGTVVEKDLKQAEYWFRLSAEKNNRNAKYNLKHLHDQPAEIINPNDIEPIIISPDDCEYGLPKNIVAFSYAEPGAMGVGGDVTMVSDDQKIYELNYLYDGWDYNFLQYLLNELVESAQSKWHPIDLGMGNYLFVSDVIWEDFSLTIDEQTLSQLHFRAWIGIVINIKIN